MKSTTTSARGQWDTKGVHVYGSGRRGMDVVWDGCEGGGRWGSSHTTPRTAPLPPRPNVRSFGLTSDLCEAVTGSTSCALNYRRSIFVESRGGGEREGGPTLSRLGGDADAVRNGGPAGDALICSPLQDSQSPSILVCRGT